MIMRQPLLVCTILCAALMMIAAWAWAVSDSEGAAAPTKLGEGFTAMTLDGREVSLAEYQGKVVVLNFWATWCFPCLYEMPLLQRIHTRFEERGLTVVAVAVFDELESVREYQAKYGYTFPILFDGSGAAKETFDMLGVPQTYIFGRDGALVSFEDPVTHEVSRVINDPTVWERPAIAEFLELLVAN